MGRFLNGLIIILAMWACWGVIGTTHPLALPNYVVVTRETALLRPTPDATAEITYSAFPGIIFSVVSENATFYEVSTVDDVNVWVAKDQVSLYTGPPPPVTLYGTATKLESLFDPKSPISDLETIATAPDVPTAPPTIPSISTESVSENGMSSSAIRDVAIAPPIIPSISTESVTENGMPSSSIHDVAIVPPTIPSISTGSVTENRMPTPSLAEKIQRFVDTDVSRSETIVVPTVTAAAPPTSNPYLFRFRPTYSYLPPIDEMFTYPPKPISRYPQLDVDGEYEMKLSGRDYKPKLNAMSPTDNRWGIIQNDPVYTKLPSDVLVGSPKFDMRFRFNIDGKLADDLSVHYDIAQEPDFPGKYDVSVKYQHHDLTFFHLESEFQNGEFINYRKSLNGVRYTTYDTNWSVILSAGKQRSEPKKFETNGNGRSVYNVGVRSLLNDSVKVWVNNVLLTEGADYKVNYFEGEISFRSIKGPADHIEVIYEFTNPIEDFIPVLSRKNFIGAQYLWKATQLVEEAPKVIATTESVIVTTGSSLIGSRNITLKSTTIVLGSDTVVINGETQRRNIDYALKARKGVIMLLHRDLADGDSVSINYSAYDVVDKMDELIGDDTRGPYMLASANVLDDSETVFLDKKVMTSGIDYDINTETGAIQFAYPIPYPSIITVKYRAERTEPIGNNSMASGSPFNFGVSYLDEYAAGQNDQMELSVVSENITINNGTFKVANNPLTALDSLSVLVDGVPFVSGNSNANNTYSVDPYTGIFTVHGTSSGTGQVSYKYRKSYQTTFVFQAIGNGVNIYQNNNQMTLRDVPVKFNGVRYIKVYNGIVDETLIASQDYTIAYGDGTNGFTIQFYKRGDSIDSSLARSLRERYPDAGQRITLVYDHSPDAAPDAGTIAQHQFGLTFGSKLTKNLRVDTELSGAENNLTREQLQTEYLGTGQGNGATYSLGFKNVVENSETVYLNDIPLARDRDYSINYVNGTFRLINLSPGNSDKIRVRFQYIDPSGQTRGGASKGYRFAGKIATQYKDGPWTVNADWKSIDKNFSPISPIQAPRGTNSFGGSVEYRGEQNQLFSGDYRTFQQYIPPSGVKDNLYKRTSDFGLRTVYTIANMVEVDQSIRYNWTYSDPGTDGATGNIYSDDMTSFIWNTSLGYGPQTNRYTFNRSYSRSESGYLDGYDRTTNETDSYQLSTIWKWNKLFLAGDTDVRPLFEYSQNTVRALKTTTGVQSEAVAFTRKIGVGSHYAPLQQLDIGIDFSTQEQNTIADGVSATPSRITNYRVESNYRPANWLTLFGSMRNNEEFSPALGQKGRLSNDAKYQVSNFSPYGLLSAAGVSENTPLMSVIKNSFFTYNYGIAQSQENNDQLKKLNNSQSVAYNGFSPIPGVTIPRVVYTVETSNSNDDASTSISSRNASNRDYAAYNGRLDVRLPLPIVDKFGYGLTLDSKREIQTIDQIANSATSNRSKDSSPYDKRIQSLSFDPGPLAIGIPGLFMVNLGTFKTNVDETIYNSTSVKEVQQYSVSSSNASTAQDNSKKYDLGGTVVLSPFNIITVNSSGHYSTEQYSRNLTPANTGLTYRIGQNYTADAAYSPFSFIGFNVAAKYDQSTQFRSPSLNMDIDTLQSVGIRTSESLFTDLLVQKSWGGSAGITVTPVSFFSVKGSGAYTTISDSQTTTSNTSITEFVERAGTLGVEFRPISGLASGYDYTLRFTSTSGGNDVKGYTGRFSASYTPIQTATMNVSITYTRSDTWGVALNRLQQTETEKGTGDRIRYSVDEQNNTVETGSLSVNIIIPFKDNPYLRDLTLTGEGQIKRVTDAFDGTRAAAGGQQIGYEISGLVLKALIRF